MRLNGGHADKDCLIGGKGGWLEILGTKLKLIYTIHFKMSA